MKKFIIILKINLLLFVITTCIQSCTKDNVESGFNEEKTTSSEVLEWDESFHPYDTETKTTATNQSDQMAVTSSNIYIGAVYAKESVNDLTFDWISKPVEPIYVSYTFPRYYFDEIQRPSVSSMYRSLNKAISSPQFSGKQSLSFEYDMRQFMKYSELKLAFGAKVNVASIFKLEASFNDTNIKSKSGLFARVVQKNFSLIMDYPYDGNIFLNNDDLNDVQEEEPLYINSIIFGRMAILAIESDYSYDELKAAVKASFTAKIVNGELGLSAEHKKILQESTMRIFVSGGAGQDVAKIVEGYNEFTNFIINGGEFTEDVPGVPIFFTANYVKDNSVFSSTF
ncbi:MAG: thiol-activated cytolysin family protein [Candidatus Cryptobacteroides sp.]